MKSYRQEKAWEKKQIFEEIIDRKFPKYGKDIHTQIQKDHRTPSKINTRKSHLWTSSNYGEEKILKVEKTFL